jgi:hypothetical protein
MWKPWRNTFEPWRTMPGWEFDLLRTLPTDVAKRLYLRAWEQARSELMKRWQWWAGLGLVLVSLGPSVVLVWVAAANLGMGPLGRLALEFAFHATLGAIILHPLVRLQERHERPCVRGALVDELLGLVRDELAPPPPPRRRSRVPA